MATQTFGIQTHIHTSTEWETQWAGESFREEMKNSEEKTRNSSRAMVVQKKRSHTITTTSGITHRSTDNNNKNQVFVRTNFMIFMNEIFLVLIDLMVGWMSTMYVYVHAYECVCLDVLYCMRVCVNNMRASDPNHSWLMVCISAFIVAVVNSPSSSTERCAMLLLYQSNAHGTIIFHLDKLLT